MPPSSSPRARATTTSPPRSWLSRLGRIGDEVYIGAMVLGLLAVAAGAAALVVQAAFGLSRWVQLGD